ncbi:MAG: hypothetical protein Q9209_006203 [Squamulea sp. 1 TL-2023]
MERSNNHAGVGHQGKDQASETAVGVLEEAEMLRITDTIQSLASDLHETTISLAQNLINIPVTLDANIEHAVEDLLRDMATMVVMFREEQVKMEMALQSMT